MPQMPTSKRSMKPILKKRLKNCRSVLTLIMICYDADTGSNDMIENFTCSRKLLGSHHSLLHGTKQNGKATKNELKINE